MFPAYLFDLYTIYEGFTQPLGGVMDARTMFLGRPFYAWLRRAEFLLGHDRVRHITSLQQDMVQAIKKAPRPRPPGRWDYLVGRWDCLGPRPPGRGGYLEATKLRREHRRLVKIIEAEHPMAAGGRA